MIHRTFKYSIECLLVHRHLLISNTKIQPRIKQIQFTLQYFTEGVLQDTDITQMRQKEFAPVIIFTNRKDSDGFEEFSKHCV